MGQIVGLDSAIFIYVLERNEDFWEQSLEVIKFIEDNVYTGVFATIGVIEVLTGAKKRGRFSAAKFYKEKIYNYPNLTIKNLDDNIIETASDLRAKYNLRTPDAIHIATAIDAGAKKFITNDKSLKRIKEIKIELLS